MNLRNDDNCNGLNGDSRDKGGMVGTEAGRVLVSHSSRCNCDEWGTEEFGAGMKRRSFVGHPHGEVVWVAAQNGDVVFVFGGTREPVPFRFR